jgi:hypothetical protein
LANWAAKKKTERPGDELFGKWVKDDYILKGCYSYPMRRSTMTTFTLNGKGVSADLPDDTPLLWALREHEPGHLLIGTKQVKNLVRRSR